MGAGFGRSNSVKAGGAFQSMSLTTAGETVSKNIDPTMHWGSQYKATVNEVASRDRIVSRRPLWSINRQAYISARGSYTTEFADSFGNHGHVPRDRLPHDAKKQEHRENELTVGTTQVTKHIPGYNGFIPHVDVNQRAVDQSKGQLERNTIIKQNIVEN